MKSKDLSRLARAQRALRLQSAREKAEDFISYAFKHEQTGAPIENAWFHVEWQETLRSHNRVILMAPVEHAKSQQIAVGKVLHELGTNPNLRIGLISNTAEQSQKLLRAIRTHIESNLKVREVFPHLLPSQNLEDPWHQSQITVQRKAIAKDPSVQAHGVFGPVVGARLDRIILDDILDFENTRTQEQRQKLLEWVETSLITRLTKRASIWVIGTPWDPEDLLHELSNRSGFVFRHYSAVHNPDDPPHQWAPIWPEQWPLERLLEQRASVLDSVFSRKWLCRVKADTASRFRAGWLDGMTRAGIGRTFYLEAPKSAGGVRNLPCFTGVDLGIGQGETDALTVMFTLAIDERGRRIVSEIESGRWTAPEILYRLRETYRRFDSHIFVEDNGAQKFLVQIANSGGTPLDVRGLTTTGYNKHHEEFGVESLAVEMRNGWWVLPSGMDGRSVPEEGKAWLSELRNYDPKRHTGDRLMASWIAREGARLYGMPRGTYLDTQAR